MTRTLPMLLASMLFVVPRVSAAQGARDTEGEAEMLARINALRVEASLPALVRHAALDEAALVHSMDMAEHEMLAHVSPRTGDPAARVADTGVHATRIAQNIALRRSTAEALVSILESEAHRRQLLTPELTHVGLAAVHGARGMYVTQVVAELEGPTPLPPPAFHDLRAARTPGGDDRATDARAAAGDSAPEAHAEPGSVADSDSEIDADPEVDAEPDPGPNAAAAAEAGTAADAAVSADAPALSPVDPRDQEFMETAPHESATREGAAPDAVAPTIRLPYGARPGVAGYWVFHGSRWWFFPNAGSAAPGSVLHADPSVQGPPAGYDDAGRPTSSAVAPPLPPRPAFGWSPRRHYLFWRQDRF